MKVKMVYSMGNIYYIYNKSTQKATEEKMGGLGG